MVNNKDTLIICYFHTTAIQIQRNIFKNIYNFTFKYYSYSPSMVNHMPGKPQNLPNIQRFITFDMVNLVRWFLFICLY